MIPPCPFHPVQPLTPPPFQYDTDKNGEIDFNEFVALSMALRTNAMSAEEDAMAKLFASIDVDGNRYCDTCCSCLRVLT